MTTILGVSVKVWYRRTIQLILGLFVLVTAVSGMLVANAALGDWQISRDRGVAVAEVVEPGNGTFGEQSKVLVRYRDSEAVYHSPDRGLKYPTGLNEGERVWVEYQRSDTENVKVMGRSWTLSILPALSVWAIGAAVTVLLLLVVRWRWVRRTGEKFGGKFTARPSSGNQAMSE